MSGLHCIPPDRDESCLKPARWYVWHKDCGNIYTYACDEHLSDQLLFGEVVNIARIPEKITEGANHDRDETNSKAR